MQMFNPAKLSKNARQAQGIYNIKNMEKYAGVNKPIYRSSWEKDFMVTCDLNPAVIEWAIEPFPIQYQCPITHTVKNYWPDFLIKFRDVSGAIKLQMIEIKPLKQAYLEFARSRKDKLAFQVNNVKWAYAREYCKRNGIEFVVLTERELYRK